MCGAQRGPFFERVVSFLLRVYIGWHIVVLEDFVIARKVCDVFRFGRVRAPLVMMMRDDCW